MSGRAGAVVVGGGVFGASAALHLVEAGIEDVVLLERDDLAQGTSFAGGGFVAVWASFVSHWGEDEAAVEHYSLSFYRELAASGKQFDFKQNGNLFAATSDPAWSQHLAGMQRSPYVADQQILSPEDVARVTGIVARDGVVGGILHPSGAQVSGPKAARAIASRFVERGGRIETRMPVRRVLLDGQRVTGVETLREKIEADHVVVAAGAWTNQILRTVDAWVPIVPLVATRIKTEPLGIPSTMPTVMFPEFATMWLREDHGALLWGAVYENATRFAYVDQLPEDRFEGLPLDGLHETQRLGIQASTAVPLLTRYRSVTMAQGAPCYTPDLNGIVGAVPGFDGLWVMCGCNESGITHGPGWGRLLAERIVTGASSLTSSSAFDPARFDGTCKTEADVLAAMKHAEGNVWDTARMASRPGSHLASRGGLGA